MSEQKKQLLKSLAEATERMNEDALEKVVTFTAGVSAGAACAKSEEAKATKHAETAAKSQAPKPEEEPAEQKEVG